MRLISCYIEGFGDIRKRDYIFSEGVSCFCEANGSGKSTLAAFIKAMFYGMESVRKNAKEFNDRMHYYPFEGGVFGGNLVFEMQGDTYKIERFFDEKSTVQDSLTVYKNAEPYEGFGEEVGRAVFGIDKASFERTVFVDAHEIEIASTSGINAKLGAFVQGEEEGGLETALAALNDERKRYKKMKNSNDLITRTMNEILRLEAEIQNLTTIQGGLAAKHAHLAEMEGDLRRVEALLKLHNETTLVLKDWEVYENAANEIKALSATLKELKARYPKGMPEAGELEVARGLLEKDAAFRTEAGVAALSEEEARRLSDYRDRFAGGVPSKETLDMLDEGLRRHEVLSYEIKKLEADGLSDKDRSLMARFEGRVPSEEAMKQADRQASEYAKIDRLYRETPARLEKEEKQAPKKGINLKLWVILAVVFSLGGLALLFVHTLIGAVVAVLGVLGLLAVAFWYLNRKVNDQASQSYENPQKLALSSRLSLIEDQLKAFLIPLGYFSGRGITVDFANLQNDLASYYRFADESAERQKALVALRKERESVGKAVTKTLGDYGLAYTEGVLPRLRAAVSDYETLTRRQNDEKKRLDALAEKRGSLAEELSAFAARYGFDRVDMALLDSVKKDAETLVRLEKEIKRRTVQNEAFFKEKGLTEKPTREPIDENQVECLAQALREGVVKMTGVIEDEERRVEELDLYLRERDQKKAELDTYKKRYALLTAAKDFLVQADKTLKERYVKPVKDEFLKHAAVVEKALGERVVMDHTYTIRFERGGKERSDRHLSTGQHSICAFAFRLALLEQMYPDEKPFLILDDPFTSLDSTHFDKMAELLKEIAKTSQILYFTCHESRMI